MVLHLQVAGYPEAHPDVISEDPEQMREAYWKDIHYLKEKVRLSDFCMPSLLRMTPGPLLFGVRRHSFRQQ